MDNNENDIHNFIVFGVADQSLSPLDNTIIMCGGRQRVINNKTEIKIEFDKETYPNLSSFISCFTKTIVDKHNDIVICYDLTWCNPDKWLSKLCAIGFTISIQPDCRTGRKVAICCGKGELLQVVNWFEPVYGTDATFLVECSNNCDLFRQKVEAKEIYSIYKSLISNKDEIWEVIGNLGLTIHIDGDEFDFLTVNARKKSRDIKSAIIHTVNNFNYILYDAGIIKSWAPNILIGIKEFINDMKWYDLPEEWKIIT